MKKAILFFAVTLTLALTSAPAFALLPDPPTPPPPPPASSQPFRVDVSPLPKPTAGPAKIQAVLTVLFTILGAICLLMITIGGFRYITSEGNPQALSKAKGTVIYALVGLLVSILAVSIVTFVIGKVST